MKNKCKLCKLAASPVEIHPIHREHFVIGGLDAAGFCEDCQQLPSELLFEWLVADAKDKTVNMTGIVSHWNKRLNTRGVYLVCV